MADLSSLIRLHKHELDEKQRQISELYDQINQLEQHRKKIQDQRAHEMQAAENNTEMPAYTLSGYIKKSKFQEQQVNSMIFQVNQKIETMRDEMLDIFGELKKYELTQNERLAMERQERKLKEGKMFDEIAISGFRRQDEE